jgi:uncharacterized LabA/DUF88 family protein
MAMPRRVGVLIDYQNTYNDARDTFHDRDNDPSRFGNVRPVALANLLAGKGPGRFDLTYVGVYCGMPDSSLDPKGFAAQRRRVASWEKEGATVHSRTLWYPPPWAIKKGEKPREKGVDVQLAVHAITKSIAGDFDTIVIASTDTDLDALVEALLELKETIGKPQAIEAIAWHKRTNTLKQGPDLTMRWIGALDYGPIRDDTDYNQSS